MSSLKINQAGLVALLTTVVGQLVAFVPSFAQDKQILISAGSAVIAAAFLVANAVHAIAETRVSKNEIKTGVTNLVHDELDKVNFTSLVQDAVNAHSFSDAEANIENLVRNEVQRVLSGAFSVPPAHPTASATPLAPPSATA